MKALKLHDNEQRSLSDLAPGVTRTAAIVGGIALVAAIVLAVLGEGAGGFFRAYVVAFAFAVSFPLGALFFVMVNHVTRAGWSVAVRRVAELLMGTLLYTPLLFIPVLVPIFAGWHEVYPWADANVVAHDALLASKTGYLNVPFFLIRIAVYFAVWAYLARTLLSKSLEQDQTGNPELTLQMERVSAVGLFLFAGTVTFFAFDTLMSLAPHWFSTIFGVYYFAGSTVGFLALFALILLWLQRNQRLTHAVTVEHYHDIGKLLFGFIVFWAYISFSQYLLIWYANIPEETQWFLARQTGPWLWATLVLLFGHFLAPFLFLLNRDLKRNRVTLAAGAMWMVVMHFVDVFWAGKPVVEFTDAGTLVNSPFPIHLLDIALAVALLVIVLVLMVRQMARHPLAPTHDPRLGESLAFENV